MGAGFEKLQATWDWINRLGLSGIKRSDTLILDRHITWPISAPPTVTDGLWARI